MLLVVRFVCLLCYCVCVCVGGGGGGGGGCMHCEVHVWSAVCGVLLCVWKGGVVCEVHV